MIDQLLDDEVMEGESCSASLLQAQMSCSLRVSRQMKKVVKLKRGR